MPLPALDGGRCITVLLRSATTVLFPTTKELSEKIEQHWHVGGFIFLMVLSLLVAVKDVFTLFSR